MTMAARPEPRGFIRHPRHGYAWHARGTMRRRWLRSLRDPFFVVGVACILVSLGLGTRRLREVSRCGHATGIVSDYAPVNAGSASKMRRPVATYDVGDRSYGITFGSASEQVQPPLGTRVGILYLPEAPGAAWVDDSVDLYLAPLILGAVGLVSTFLWAVSRRFHRWRH